MNEFEIGRQYAEEQQAVDTAYLAQTFNPKLMAIRAQLPFVSIMPLPNSSVSVQLAANAAQDITFPEGTKVVMFQGDGTYYVSRNGQAQIPNSTTPDGSGSIMNPEYTFFYVEEIKSVSVIAPAQTHLTVHCFMQL